MKSFWKPLSWDNCSSLRNLHNILFEVSYTWTRRKKLWGYAAFFLQTTNRHAKYVVENAVLRFTIQQQINSKPDTKKQLLMISHQSKLLEKHGNSFYLNEFVKKNPVLFQVKNKRLSKRRWGNLTGQGQQKMCPRTLQL